MFMLVLQVDFLDKLLRYDHQVRSLLQKSVFSLLLSTHYLARINLLLIQKPRESPLGLMSCSSLGHQARF